MDTGQQSTQLDAPIQRSWRGAFLAALRKTGNVRRACEACEICRQTAYDLRNADPTFAREWEAAQEDFADLLEEEAVRRALGTRELVIHQGRPCGAWILDGQIVTETTPGAKLIPLYENRYSDALIQFELRGRRRAKYNPPPEAPAPTAEPQSGNADEILADLHAEYIAAGGAATGAPGAVPNEDRTDPPVDPDIRTTGGSVPEPGG